MILDTAYLLDLLASDRDAFRKGSNLVDRGEVQWLPTPVVAEVYYGVATARSDETGRAVRNRLLGYPRVDVDEEVARTAGELVAAADDAAGGDAGVGANDAYVAAIAEILDDAVLTADASDFRALGVAVETY